MTTCLSDASFEYEVSPVDGTSTRLILYTRMSGDGFMQGYSLDELDVRGLTDDCNAAVPIAGVVWGDNEGDLLESRVMDLLKKAAVKERDVYPDIVEGDFFRCEVRELRSEELLFKSPLFYHGENGWSFDNLGRAEESKKPNSSDNPDEYMDDDVPF